jgi:alpha-N-arabinofuranosidase
MDGFIDEVVGICDQIQAEKGSKKQVHLSFDEWNVWYRTRRGDDRKKPGWPIAPPILEEVYTMKDALSFGGACISLLNHADRVKSACLAQLVNAIAPILTETGGPAWRQTIFWPFADFSTLGRGTVLKCSVDSPTYATTYFDPRGTTELRFPMPAVPFVKASAVHSESDGTLTLFLLNRNLDEAMTVTVSAAGFPKLVPGKATTLRHDDLEAANSRDEPDAVRPTDLDGVEATEGGIRVTLPPASWSTIRLGLG